jgi:predicted DCC family thiol-disulfide oxidoreductase YuxK
MRRRGIDREAAKKRLHVVTADGELLAGVDAFLALWREMPRYRPLARVVGLPGVKQLAHLVYEGLLAPGLYAFNRARGR